MPLASPGAPPGILLGMFLNLPFKILLGVPQRILLETLYMDSPRNASRQPPPLLELMAGTLIPFMVIVTDSTVWIVVSRSHPEACGGYHPSLMESNGFT